MRTSLQDRKGRNALMEAAAKGHDSAVTMLLAAGTPWNAIDKEGSCAGDLAVAAGHESTAEILLDAGKIFFHTSTRVLREQSNNSIRVAAALACLMNNIFLWQNDHHKEKSPVKALSD